MTFHKKKFPQLIIFGHEQKCTNKHFVHALISHKICVHKMSICLHKIVTCVDRILVCAHTILACAPKMLIIYTQY